ncbi:MAG: CvpA family protein [Acutalibacteraceae bacterium]|jgi:uncharacterized membrane protein required for colicin V production
MPIVLDVLIVVILGISLHMGYRHGLVRSVVKLIGCVAALVLAVTLSHPVGEWTYDTFFQSRVESGLSDRVEQSSGRSVRDTAREAIEELPGGVRAFLGDSQWLDEALAKFDDSVTYEKQEIVTAVSRDIIRPVAVTLLGVIAFLLLFILLLIAVALLAKLVGKLARIPGLRQVDGALGALLGLIEGVVIVLAAVALIQVAVTSAGDDAWLTKKDVDQTVVFGWVADHDPLTPYLDKLA